METPSCGACQRQKKDILTRMDAVNFVSPVALDGALNRAIRVNCLRALSGTCFLLFGSQCLTILCQVRYPDLGAKEP
jgi:hypothetical protein